MGKQPKGATVVKEESVNEVADQERKVKKANSMEDYIAAMAEAEKANSQPKSGDLDVVNIKMIDPKRGVPTNEGAKVLRDLQKQGKLVGFSKLGVCLVLKEGFIEKKKAKEA